MEAITRLKRDYPWTQTPLIASAPMRLISLAEMAVAVSQAGGLGFLASGTDTSTLATSLSHAHSLLKSSPPLPTTPSTLLPLGIGFINWSASLPTAIPLIALHRPAAVWFFAPASLAQLAEWTAATREASPGTKIWVQIGSVNEAVEVVRAVAPDVLVVQGADAGGHGLERGAGVVSLVPEVDDKVRGVCRASVLSSLGSASQGEGKKMPEMPVLIAAGGIADARGAAAALALGAGGVLMGTRFLATHEAKISKGYREEVVRAGDGGQSTVRTKVYDQVRGTDGWPERYNGRGVVNRSYVDAVGGMNVEENKKLYTEEIEKGDEGWGVDGRMTTYAGSAVGLVREVKPAGEVVREVREGVGEVLRRTFSAQMGGMV